MSPITKKRDINDERSQQAKFDSKQNKTEHSEVEEGLLHKSEDMGSSPNTT